MTRGLRLGEVALLAAGLAAFGLVTLALVFAGEPTFAALTDPRGAALRGGGTVWQVDAGTLRVIHRDALAYVLGEAPALPARPDGSAIFDANERSHMADVRTVFTGARAAQLAGLIVVVAVLWINRARGRRALAGALGR
ncbi:MAG: DUF1461 domain-containing protein, partial [Chloroflexi bacterium]|nr:DUF1461 domain-containing protein [Chloroflexota bacterium]